MEKAIKLILVAALIFGFVYLFLVQLSNAAYHRCLVTATDKSICE